MKRCPECRRDYHDDSLLYCLDDGSALLEGPGSLEGATAIFRSPESEKGGRETEAATRLYPDSNPISVEIRRHKFGTLLVLVLGVVVLSGFGYGLYKLLGGSSSATPKRSSALLNSQRLTGDGKTRDAEISPDGKFMAYVRAEGGESSLWIKQIQTNSNIQIARPGELEDFSRLKFSPDGNFVYFNAESQSGSAPSVYRVPTLGVTPPVKALTNAYGISFSPDGMQISFIRLDLAVNQTSIIVANADGSNERVLATRTGTQWFQEVTSWSPDGKSIAAIVGDDGLAPDPSIWVTLINAADGSLKELGAAKWARLEDIVWHPSGDSLIVTGTNSALVEDQIWEISYPSGEVRRLTNNLNGHNSISITNDGRSIVTGEVYSRSAVWVSPDLKPENAKRIMPDTGDTWGFSWTPDDRIVYVSDQTGDAEIWIMDADGSNARALTSDKIFKTTPVVSPDGRYIVYTTASGSGQLVRIDIGGGNPVVFSSYPGADNPDISPDGKWVLYSAWANGASRIMRVPIEGGEPQILTDYHAIEPRYSRDGKWFACFTPNEKTQIWNRLAIVPAEGGPPVKIFDTPTNTSIGRGPIWTPDDRGITVIVSPGEKQNLWLQPFDGGPGKPMTDFDLPGIARREYSRNGKRIAIVRAQGIGNAIMITDYR